MYDINIRNVSKGKNIYFVLLVIFIFLLGVMIFFLNANIVKFNSLDSVTTSIGVGIDSYRDTEGEKKYSAIYYYEVDEIKYSCYSNSYSSIKPENKNKNVYYDSLNPERCMTEEGKSSNSFFLLFILILIFGIVFLIINIKKINKRIEIVEELNKSGKLVKNLPCHLEDTGIIVNGAKIQRIVVDYILPSGCSVTLRGDPIYDRKNVRNSDFADLVIDEKNPDNYYIDFEINRLMGNLPQDYNN